MSWIQTYTGRQFWSANPRAEDFDIRDIAHALSLTCRFNGHCREFYSVAEHSVRMSHLCSPENALWALMHDLAEAYIGDLARPVKNQMPGFSELEEKILRAASKHFCLTWPMPEEVLFLDDRLLATEARDLMGKAPADWELEVEPLDFRILPWTAQEAEERFLNRWREIQKEPG